LIFILEQQPERAFYLLTCFIGNAQTGKTGIYQCPQDLVSHKFYASPEPKDNTERNAGDQMLDFIIFISYGLLSSLKPFSETKFYEVKEFVFKI